MRGSVAKKLRRKAKIDQGTDKSAQEYYLMSNSKRTAIGQFVAAGARRVYQSLKRRGVR